MIPGESLDAYTAIERMNCEHVIRMFAAIAEAERTIEACNPPPASEAITIGPVSGDTLRCKP